MFDAEKQTLIPQILGYGYESDEEPEARQEASPVSHPVSSTPVVAAPQQRRISGGSNDSPLTHSRRIEKLSDSCAFASVR